MEVKDRAAGKLEKRKRNKMVRRPAVLVVICACEQEGDLSDIITARLRDPYPNLRIVCLLDPGDLAPTLRHRFRKETRVAFADLPPHADGAGLADSMAKLAGDALLLWQSGSRKDLYLRLPHPLPLTIAPEDAVDYFVDDGIETCPAVAPPEYLNIGLTNRCNYRCFFCNAEKNRIEMARLDLPIEVFFSMKTAIEEAGVVDLTSPGEVLMYTHIREAMKFVALHNRHKGFQFTTTGTLLSEEMLLPVAHRVDQITVSLNAATRETYERDMGSKLWDRVLSNVQHARRHLSRDKITLGFVAHADNIDELPDLVRLAGRLDVWHVRIAPIFVQKPEFIRKSLWFCKAKAQELIGEARRIGESHGVIVSNIHDSVRQLSDSSGTECAMPGFGSYITPSGTVIPCCYAGPHIMGNVFHTGSFEKVWNGKKYRALRERLYFRQCRTCPNIRMDVDRLESHVATEAFEKAGDALPLVSVILKVTGASLDPSLGLSALRDQTYPIWELLVPIDGQDDGLLARQVEEAAKTDSRIRAVPTEASDPREVILGAALDAKGSFVTLLDLSRPCRPDRLETAITAFGQLGPEWIAAYEIPDNGEFIDLATALVRHDAVPELFAGLKGNVGKRLHRLSRDTGSGFGESPVISAPRLCMHGEKLLEAGFTEDAIDAFREACRIDPECANAYNNLGVLEWGLGNFGEAIMCLSQALCIDSENLAALVNLAEIFLYVGYDEKARRTINRILEIDPGAADAVRLSERLESRKVLAA